jgi:hypothetical protein
MLRVTVDTLVENEEARNELVLFGLRDWTLKAWDRLQESVGRTLRPNESGASLSLRMFRIGADELAKNAFYVR